MRITGLSLAAMATLAVLSAPAAAEVQPERPLRILIDADTANEVDDLNAIARGLVAPELTVVGLSSAHWQVSHWAPPDSLEQSQRLNEVLLALFERPDVPHPRGAPTRLYDWGRDVAQHSAAAYHLIEQARATPAGEKLTVAILGAGTNVASALLIDPATANRLRVYLLGTQHEGGVWRKRDFNCMNDLHALDVILDAAGLETHVMPVNVAAALTFSMQEVEQRLAGRHPALDLLHRRWVEHLDGGRYSRVIWDLALLEAILRPGLASEARVTTPPENTRREVSVYTRIDAEGMKADFYRALDSYLARRNQRR